MTITAGEQVFVFEASDPLVRDRLLPHTEEEVAQAHKAVKETITPQRLAMALCDSYVERREFREEAIELHEALLCAKALLDNTIRLQHELVREASTSKVINAGKRGLEARSVTQEPRYKRAA